MEFQRDMHRIVIQAGDNVEEESAEEDSFTWRTYEKQKMDAVAVMM